MNKEEIIKILDELLEIPQSTNGTINFYSIESNKFETIIILIKKHIEDLQCQLEQSKKFIKMIENETYQASIEGICDTALERLGGIDE